MRTLRYVGLLVLLGGCNKGARPSGPAACDAVDLVSACGEYTTLEAARDACPALGGAAAAGSCPGGAVVRCEAGDDARHYYDRGGLPWTSSLASRHCFAVLGGEAEGAP